MEYRGPEKKETLFKHRVARDLGGLPRTWFKKIQSVAVRGIPDFLCCVNGYFVALELKPDETTKLEPLQRYNLAQIENANGLAYLVTPETWPEIFNMLSGLASRRRGFDNH